MIFTETKVKYIGYLLYSISIPFFTTKIYSGRCVNIYLHMSHLHFQIEKLPGLIKLK